MSQDLEKRYQKLKIKEILEDIKETDVKVFIASYAKKDKAFELAFKSHFLSRVYMGDEGLKYKRMLTELIKPKTAAHSKISPSNKRTIHFILDDFVLQMKDCLSTENYTEAFHIAKESLDKIIYLMHRYGIKDASLEKNRVNFINGLDIILKQDLAPSFRQQAEQELMDLINKSYYIPGKNNTILILNKLNAFNAVDQISIITELYEKYNLSNPDPNIIRTSIILSYKNIDLCKNILLKYDHSRIFDNFRSLIKDNHIETVEYYFNEEAIGYRYQVIALQCYRDLATADYKALANNILELNTKNTDYQTFEDIRTALPDTFLKKEFTNIRDWIDSLSFKQTASMYAKAHRYRELLALIKEKGDIEWLKVYDSLLIEQGHEEGVKKLYLSIVDDYFDNHLGNKATEFLDRTKRHLHKISQASVINDITMHLSKKFAHRKTIKSKLG